MFSFVNMEENLGSKMVQNSIDYDFSFFFNTQTVYKLYFAVFGGLKVFQSLN